MAEVKWTPAQQDAIAGGGGNLLVSAAAGSGKTAVLSQRVLRILTDAEHPVDADRLLIVTFTNAAAAEMKQRIGKKLWEYGQQHPEDMRVARQQLLLESAQISTIHSFCISLLRAHFHLLGLSADFRIGEERELEVLRMATVRRVLERRYAQADPVFFDLVELVSTSRSDSKLEQSVLRLYDFLRNHPFYEEWLDRVARSYSADTPLEQSPWFAILMDYACDALDYCVTVTAAALEEMERDEQLLTAYGPAFQNDLVQLQRCAGALGADWDTARDAIRGVVFGNLGRLAGYPDEAKKKRFQALRSGVKDTLGALRDKHFLLSAAQYRQDMGQLAPMVDELFDVVLEFDAEYTAVKRQKNLLDFGDLEHEVLRLLYDSEHGEHTPSTAARELRLRYHEILIDEYQDTNGAQEMIFRALESDRGNRFLVGDVKQSIYRFRQARPENFLEKKADYAPYDGHTFPARISLSANFRTRQETTEVINFLFGLLMSRKVGEMEYLPEDALNAAGGYDYSFTLPVQLLVTDPALQPEQAAEALEARMVAAEIRELLESGAAQPGDICILLRSPRKKAAVYVQELDRVGVRCWSDRQESFLNSREIAPVVSFLKILANPLLDLELSRVLCSYLYGFTSEMLARLRLAARGSLFAALLAQEQAEAPCKAFLEDFRLLRREAVSRPASQILQLLYAVTFAEQKTLAMDQGAARRGNLRLLAEYAASYGGGADLSGFLDYLYALEEYECDLPCATIAAGNAVSIMSIHRSKGLEFPVVFLCDTASQFNTTDLTEQMLLHPELGFACVLRDNREMTQHRTIPLAAMSLENRRALLSEELRVLYVALTRARERLYITAADKKLAKLSRGAAAPLRAGRLSPWTVRSAGCYLDWLAAALCRHPDFPGNLVETRPVPVRTALGQGALAVRVELPACAEQETPLPERGGGGGATVADQVLVDRLRQQMHWQYPFQADTVTPVKLSVSQLTKADSKQDFYFTRRPKLLTQKSLTPAERGVAAHKFMQFADYAAAAADPAAEAARLAAMGFITAEEGENVDPAAIRKLFAGSLGRRILAVRELHREIRFMCEFTPAQLAAVSPQLCVEGNTVVQGVADCVLIEQGSGVIVDYKTDHVKTMRELADRYSVQLRLYRHILEGLLELPIEQCVLYSFSLGQEILVEL